MDELLDGSEDLRSALAAWDDVDPVTVRTRLAYRTGEPVVVRVRRRGRRFDISDGGRAVLLAGTPGGWLQRIERLVAVQGLNVNRRGVVYVPATHGRDIASLALRLAGTARSVYLELLDATVV